MTKPVLHTVEGSEDTRRSPRVYTHAVVATFNLSKGIAATIRSAEHSAADSWDTCFGPAYVATNQSWTNNYRTRVLTPDTSDFGIQFTAKINAERAEFRAANPDRAAYIAMVVEKRVAEYRSRVRADGSIYVMQWSMSERNAIKGISQVHNDAMTNVRVVPVIRASNESLAEAA